MFEIGERIVCVDAKTRKAHAPTTELVEGKVYTVRDISPQGGIYLEEIINEKHPYFNREWAYFEDRFRPIKSTNISIFLKMLEPTSEKVG